MKAPIEQIALVGPPVQGSLLRYSWGSGGKNDRGVLLFALPAGPERERMTVHASLDEGATWAASRLVNEKYSAYSSLVRQADDRVGLLYETDHYQFIRCGSDTPKLASAWLDGRV